ncbi:hypothetical protein HPB52_019811 [Rhipicephalus sanguineus]|uniref:CCHC-type domain-containing protein n=1 Tax=Rhipicephalus sanguineus TaxID=34632 RepID=A0A9D4T4T6_RHISA|nr:hypothetical protein HPB52_019811 [Rhipicephalus sanguineus]
MDTTDFILVTFEGLRVPFYIDYLGTDLRCRPYRQKVESCTKCRQLGHRQDVCPNATTALCPKCGTPDPPEDHSCTPTCIICNGAHETGSSECRLRYKPPRTPPPTPPETKPALPAKSTTQATGQRPGQEKPQSSPGHKNPATAAQPPSSKQAGPPPTPRNQERPPVDPTTRTTQRLPTKQSGSGIVLLRYEEVDLTGSFSFSSYSSSRGVVLAGCGSTGVRATWWPLQLQNDCPRNMQVGAT